MENTDIQEVKSKMSCYNGDYMSGIVVTMHSGLCEQYIKYLGLSASGFDFLIRTHPRALWQPTPPEPVLIP